MWELNCEAECPHCGHEQDTHAQFDADNFDHQGGTSFLQQDCCRECDKQFWFKAYLGFDLDIEQVWKEKPTQKDKKAVK